MTEIDNLLKIIRATPKDSTLYLLKKLPCKTGLFISDGNVLYLVPNEEHCPSMSIKTDYLKLETNVFVTAFNSAASSFENGYYNSVELHLFETSESSANLDAFVNLCLSHASYLHGQNFLSFFNSLVSLFQLPREQQYANLIGLMGELLLIEYFFKHFGQDLSMYWHTDGSLSKLDFTSPFANLEVKTTAGNSLCFRIKHDQLFTDIDNNYLISVVIEENNTGRSLEDLTKSLLQDPNYCNSLQFSINIEREKRRVSPIDSYSKHFVLKKICAFYAKDINPFEELPICVENLSYKLDLNTFSDIPLISIVLKNK